MADNYQQKHEVEADFKEVKYANGYNQNFLLNKKSKYNPFTKKWTNPGAGPKKKRRRRYGKGDTGESWKRKSGKYSQDGEEEYGDEDDDGPLRD